MEQINKQDRLKYIRDLAVSPGWAILKSEIEKKIGFKKDVLETCTKYDLDGHRGELRGLRFIINKVDEIIREN